MKKIIVIGTIVLSSLAFADNHGEGNSKNQNRGRGKTESQFSALTEQQKEEFKAMRATYGKEIKEMSLNMKSVDIKIEKELMNDLPNKLTINKLIDEKNVYRTAKDKKMMEFKLEAKEKFGIEIRHNKDDRGMDHHKNSNKNNQKNNKQNKN